MFDITYPQCHTYFLFNICLDTFEDNSSDVYEEDENEEIHTILIKEMSEITNESH